MSKRMNKELLGKIARAIENEPERYNQRTYGRKVVLPNGDCETCHCIAGWAVTLAGRGDLLRCNGSDGPNNVETVRAEAERLLGLGTWFSPRLFNAMWPPELFLGKYGMYDGNRVPTAAEAVALLDWMVENSRRPTRMDYDQPEPPYAYDGGPCP